MSVLPPTAHYRTIPHSTAQYRTGPTALHRSLPLSTALYRTQPHTTALSTAHHRTVHSLKMDAPASPAHSSLPLSRFAQYRKRKREGQPINKHRDAVELARLAALPADQLSYTEKEALRNQRRRTKKQRPERDTLSALLPPPPPSRAASPAPPAAAAAAVMLSLSPEVPSIPVHPPSLAFNTQDLEDIMVFDPAAAPAVPLAPSPPAGTTASTPVRLETSVVAAASTSAAAAMSSASKLRQAIRQKRKKLSYISGEVRRHAKHKRVAKSGRASVVFTHDPTVAALLSPVWKAAADVYASKVLAGAARWHSEAWQNRLKEKVYYVVKYGTEQATCSSIREDYYPHSKVCEDRGRRFDPADFIGSGLVEFAHFRQYAAQSNRDPNSDGAYLLDRLQGPGDPASFNDWMRRVGQFRYVMCHKNESEQRRRNWRRKGAAEA